MLRAIMEGVVYCLADCNNMLKEQGIQVTTMRACGGGSRNIVYRKMLADLFECDIHMLGERAGPLMGPRSWQAGTGLYPSVREACTAYQGKGYGELQS